ncbi:MAG: aminotransferase class III-fold pyridoxal phosphate-dependent enzyme [Planctomycetota bacterium]
MSRVVEQYKRACNSLAGGVSSSTRVNQAVGHAMLFDRAAGCRVWDLDGREYIDLCCSHGATLLGHGDARIREAVERTLARGAACSYENELHAELGELLCETVPCLERVRFTGAGTEATMHCIRLARAFTGRTKLVRFEGNFHGYHDQVMWAAAGELGQTEPPLAPISTGVTPGLDQHLIQIPYNRPDLLEQVFERHGDEIAAVICEAVYYNAGCVLPTDEFAAAMRRLTTQHGSLLIFDEILSAFRMCAGGAQEYLGVTPDLCTIGKAVGGGYPISVFGGRAEIMRRLMPEGDCQHSGTYNGHCVSVAAAGAAVRAFREPGFYPHIHAIADRLCGGLIELFKKHGVPGRVQWLGARFGIYFGIDHEVRDYVDAKKHDRDMMLRFIAAAIANGVYFHDYGGGAVHHGFCAAMREADVDEALSRLDAAIASLD